MISFISENKIGVVDLMNSRKSRIELTKDFRFRFWQVRSNCIKKKKRENEMIRKIYMI